jgi:hypothetical protein
MMLDFLGSGDAAARIQKAEAGFQAAPGSSTSQIGDAVAERV